MVSARIFDTIIVGGGVIGLSIARALKKRGVENIAIFERNEIGREASFAAAGMLAPQAEANSRDAFFDFCCDSRNLYQNFARELFEETAIDIELDKNGTLFCAFNERDAKEIRARFAWQKGQHFEVELLTAEEIRRIEPLISPSVCKGLFFANDWQVENRALLSALRKFAEINGVTIFENCEARNINLINQRFVDIETSAGNFAAENLVLATGAWTSHIKFAGHEFALPKIKPIRGQMISFQSSKRFFEHVIYSPRGYLVPRCDGRLLAGATVEDVGFENHVTEAGIAQLIRIANDISPSLKKLSLTEKRVGLRPFASDGLPVIGSLPGIENLYVATAHYRNGILLAPMTSEILADKILRGIDSKYLPAFTPDRFLNSAARMAN